MEQLGIEFEVHHHEVATGGQGEIATRFSTLRNKADETQWYKHVVRNVAKAHGKSATFMPKPLFGDNGTGMHVHQSLVARGRAAVLRRGRLRGAVGAGPALHRRPAPATAPRCSPSVRRPPTPTSGWFPASRRRFTSPTPSATAPRPSASPPTSSRRRASGSSSRPPDPSANTYLAFSAMMMAGLDGIRNRIDPGDPTDTDIYELSAEEIGNIPAVPTSMEEAVEALGNDHDYLLERRGLHPGRDRSLHRVQAAGGARRVHAPGGRRSSSTTTTSEVRGTGVRSPGSAPGAPAPRRARREPPVHFPNPPVPRLRECAVGPRHHLPEAARQPAGASVKRVRRGRVRRIQCGPRAAGIPPEGRETTMAKLTREERLGVRDRGLRGALLPRSRSPHGPL